jgi:predicted protein tyrosine phosphatase
VAPIARAGALVEATAILSVVVSLAAEEAHARDPRLECADVLTLRGHDIERPTPGKVALRIEHVRRLEAMLGASDDRIRC